MSQTLIVSEVNLKQYNLSVTTRDNGDDPKILEELAFRTIGAWLYIAGLLEQGVYMLPQGALGSVEKRYAAEITLKTNPEGVFEFTETFGDPRVTVWDSYRGSKHINFHLNSDDDPQVAISTWLANNNARNRALEKWGTVQTPNGTQPAPQSPNSPQAPVTGVIVATRAPNPKELTYSEGQLVAFDVNRIVMGTNNGSVTYALWGKLGQKYPLKTVYKTKNNSDENSPDYIAMKDLIVGLSLSVDAGKIEASGNWRMVVKAANAGDRQYLNIQSLQAVP